MHIAETKSSKFGVRPNDSHTNMVVSENFPGLDYPNEKGIQECKYSFIRQLIKSKDDLHLDFDVFINQGSGWKPWKLQPAKRYVRTGMKIRTQIVAAKKIRASSQ
jgi:hypothetical protein